MGRKKKTDQLFADYYDEWIETYKVGAVKEITLKKYYISAKFVRTHVPRLFVDELDRRAYQNLLNIYAETHEKVTTMDFHHYLKGCIQDMYHDGVIDKDPTYKAIIKGKTPREKKIKYLSKEELSRFTAQLVLDQGINMDWLILIVAKTGLRFSEALALTPNDFDFSTSRLTIDKTWNYKSTKGCFDLTKNTSSVRKILIDWQIVAQFSQLVKDLEPDEPIFVEKLDNGNYKRLFNSTFNNRVNVLCKQAGVPDISMHCLRHTHASILLVNEVSIQTIAQRLGHSSTQTTQETYLHIIKELEQKDEQKMMAALSAI